MQNFIQNQMVNHSIWLDDKSVMLPKTPVDGSYPNLGTDHLTVFQKYNGFHEMQQNIKQF